MLTTLDWKGWVFKNYGMMNRLASPPWNKHNLNKTNLGSNSVINLTTHNITCKQIFQYHLGSIDTVAFQRTSREGLHSITQLQLAPSIEHQISAMFSILVRCFDIPPLLSTCLIGCSSVFKNWIFGIWPGKPYRMSRFKLFKFKLFERGLSRVRLWFYQEFLLEYLVFFENIILATSSRYPIKSHKWWNDTMMTMYRQNRRPHPKTNIIMFKMYWVLWTVRQVQLEPHWSGHLRNSWPRGVCSVRQRKDCPLHPKARSTSSSMSSSSSPSM